MSDEPQYDETTLQIARGLITNASVLGPDGHPISIASLTCFGQQGFFKEREFEQINTMVKGLVHGLRHRQDADAKEIRPVSDYQDIHLKGWLESVRFQIAQCIKNEFFTAPLDAIEDPAADMERGAQAMKFAKRLATVIWGQAVRQTEKAPPVIELGRAHRR